MSDVRAELIRELSKTHFGLSKNGWGMVADAILERFEVTPKPVVPDELREAVAIQYDPDAWDTWTGMDREAEAMQRRADALEWVDGFFAAIARAGYVIVRKDEAE